MTISMAGSDASSGAWRRRSTRITSPRSRRRRSSALPNSPLEPVTRIRGGVAAGDVVRASVLAASAARELSSIKKTTRRPSSAETGGASPWASAS